MYFRGDFLKDKRAQLTIFIVFSIIIVSAVAIFLFFRGSFAIAEIPAELQPAYNSFVFCLEEDILSGATLLGSQAGYIEIPEFEPGSRYMPFSSQLDFLGNPIPYWYYVSGNNIQKTQVPSKLTMESQLADFVESKISNCGFEEYYEQGYEINFIASESEVDISINQNDIDLNLDLPMTLSLGDSTVSLRNHKLSVDSNLGSLYDSAIEVYETEQENLFLETYAVDNLRLYAPVDGVEIQCSPLIWDSGTILEDLQEGVQENTRSLKIRSSFSSEDEETYFVPELSIDNEARFLNSKDWPYTFEVNPTEGSLLISNPIGNREGLGILGFCYVPYHFVYDYKYPVLIQIFNEENPLEIFQFPLAVVLQGNQPREASPGLASVSQDSGVCEQKNTAISVNVFDSNLNSVDGRIAYECFEERCDIGETSQGSLTADFPQCVNGRIIVDAEGYEHKEQQFSVVGSGSAEVFLDRLYGREIDLRVDGQSYNGEAVVSFSSDDIFNTIFYPNQKSIELSQGQYEVQVQIYRDSSITLPETSSQQCIEVPESGLGGFFGFTDERCFDIEFPEQVISNSLSGGGVQNYFVLESQLQSSSTILINVESLPISNSIEELQNNYALFEEKGLGVSFV
ncbi:MAG: hypothetical protein WDZ77_01210 [Candidatus Pacearchaeota archaeon]